MSAISKLFTAFVSSTYVDLIHERERVADALLRVNCVPLGMEHFASTGRRQWDYIVESIESADFCVFVLAGRYGSMDAETGLSWTHREYRLARELGKPCIVLVRKSLKGLAVDRVDTDAQSIAGRDAFHREVMDAQECLRFSKEVQLTELLLASVAKLKDEGHIEGWVRARSGRPAGANADRVYSLIEAHSTYSLSKTDPSRLDMSYRGRRVMKCTSPNGINHIAIDFTKASDQESPFNPEHPPAMELVEWTRSGPGMMELGIARKSVGATFVVDLKFSPPLREHEETSFTVTGTFPEYRFANGDELFAATLNSPLGPRRFDFAARRIAYPTEELLLAVTLSEQIGATPLGPRNQHEGGPDLLVDEELDPQDTYALTPRSDGEPGFTMSFHTKKPQYRSRYRLAWQLPD